MIYILGYISKSISRSRPISTELAPDMQAYVWQVRGTPLPIPPTRQSRCLDVVRAIFSGARRVFSPRRDHPNPLFTALVVVTWLQTLCHTLRLHTWCHWRQWRRGSTSILFCHYIMLQLELKVCPESLAVPTTTNIAWLKNGGRATSVTTSWHHTTLSTQSPGLSPTTCSLAASVPAQWPWNYTKLLVSSSPLSIHVYFFLLLTGIGQRWPFRPH